MNLQQFGEAKKPEAHLENLEMRAQKPEDAAKETLRLADRMLTDEKSRLEALKMSLDAQAPERAQIQILEDEVDAAWEDLSTEVKAAVAEKPTQASVTEEELDWAFADEPTPTLAIEGNKEEQTAVSETVQENVLSKDAQESTGDLSIEGKTEEEIIDLVNLHLDEAFTGKAEALQKLQELATHQKSSEITNKFLMDECQSRLYQTFEASTFSEADMLRVIHVGEVSSESRKVMLEALSTQVGSKIAERILQEPSYLSQLTSLEASLGRPIREGGPELCTKRTFRNLVALKETVGDFSPQFAQALDLKQYSPELDSNLNYQTSKDLIEFENISIDEETGELTTKIAFTIYYKREGTDDASDESNGLIARNLHRQVQKNESGESVVTKYIEHSVFKLPGGVKDAGVAAQMTRRSLELYGDDKMNLDEIRLHANIDVGGYAWASYGYGWDDEGNASQRLAKLAENGEDIVVGGRQVFEYEELTPADKKELARQEIDELIRGCQATLDTIAASMRRRGTEMPTALYQDFTQQVTSCLNNPDLTPQDLALIGDGQAKIYKSAEGDYYLESEWEQALASGEKPAEGFKKPAILGKLVMLGSNWYGKIELKKTGSQAGKNLELLQKTLERRKV